MATTTAAKKKAAAAKAKSKASTSKSATRKATRSATSAKKADDDGPSKADQRQARDAELTERMLEMREEGTSWSEIGAELHITPGKAQFLNMLHLVETGEVKKLRHRNDDELAAVIAKARDAADEYSSWGWISARTGVSEAKLKSLHEKVNGWKPKTENISIIRAEKSGGGAKATAKNKTTGKRATAKAATPAKAAAKAKAKARSRGKAADPS